ncbi:hypothetical protein E8P82_07740 [Arthrobacter echini]|uniref:Uncharacterized protein n=1 Tax=Arthrobacter echini TaxID=1529066 RepID=A0A4S5E5T3_9MICC|nr:hypothetical protein [Arthrobacter echini]THJ66810.1 hypothetical protein E8P82_07740 [Arthrobacter echini]
MNGITERRRRPALPFTVQSLLPALLSFVGLTAMIIGILAMHVWMGGHGATAHHGTGTTSISNSASPAAGAYSIDAPRVYLADGPVTHSSSAAPVLPALTVPGDDLSDLAVPAGCGSDCSGEVALSICVLALVLVGIVRLLTPTGRALAFPLLRRGPPLAHRTSRAVPTPSLTQLCISRR